MDRYGVFGNPIGHSKSPLIHRLFAKQTGQDLTYEALLAPLERFPGYARAFFETGRGGNVTVPFKEEAYRLADELSEEEFLPLRLQNGLYLQKHAYMLRVAIP